MASRSCVQAHIAYELIGELEAKVVVIEFLTRDIASPILARQLGEQLCSLIDRDTAQYFVLDFKNVRMIGSSGFAEIVSFVRKAGRVGICNLPATLELGAAMIGLEDHAKLARDRQSAIDAGMRATDCRREAVVEMLNFVS
jgi:anti-anti-sigma regulatory factor